MTEAESPRRPDAHIEELPEGRERERRKPTGNWRTLFIDKLAETSNVTVAAEAAGISQSRAYKLRRSDPDFASAWYQALLEGYDHLEMETLHRLRAGTAKEEPKFDIANALRMLAIHRETAARERARVETRDEEAILASIDAKIAKIRVREDNAVRLLAQEGVPLPLNLGHND